MLGTNRLTQLRVHVRRLSLSRCSALVILGLTGTMATAFSGTAGAAPGYGMAGCGFGALVISSPDKVQQVLAVTVNSTSASQGFGITSGTLNCRTRKEQAQLQRQEEFIAANMITLQKEMAQGGGESVTAFAEVLGCKAQVVPEVSAHLVGAYEQIFAQPGVDGVLGAAKEGLRQSREFAANCTQLFG